MKKTEQDLILENVIDYAIFTLDPEGFIVSWNKGAERIKGYRKKEILGQHFSCFYTDEDIQSGKPQQHLKEAAAKGRFEEEAWRLRKDGSRFWANVVITALHDKTGKLLGFLKITRDLTELKEKEEIMKSVATPGNWLSRTKFSALSLQRKTWMSWSISS